MNNVVADWKASGMSAQEYSDSIGIPKTTLHFWSQVVRKTGVVVANDSAQSAALASVGKESGRFLPLVATERRPAVGSQGSITIELILKGGRRVAVSGLTLAQLTPMLVALEAGQSC